jgi:hypothetical protein
MFLRRSKRGPQWTPVWLNVQGLIGDHAYSVLRAIECNGKRFVVIRNPWGKSEWTGRWSDGSKEWTQEWLQCLPTLVINSETTGSLSWNVRTVSLST